MGAKLSIITDKQTDPGLAKDLKELGESRVIVIVGQPGTGKTTFIKAVNEGERNPRSFQLLRKQGIQHAACSIGRHKVLLVKVPGVDSKNESKIETKLRNCIRALPSKNIEIFGILCLHRIGTEYASFGRPIRMVEGLYNETKSAPPKCVALITTALNQPMVFDAKSFEKKLQESWDRSEWAGRSTVSQIVHFHNSRQSALDILSTLLGVLEGQAHMGAKGDHSAMELEVGDVQAVLQREKTRERETSSPNGRDNETDARKNKYQQLIQATTVRDTSEEDMGQAAQREGGHNAKQVLKEVITPVIREGEPGMRDPGVREADLRRARGARMDLRRRYKADETATGGKKEAWERDAYGEKERQKLSRKLEKAHQEEKRLWEMLYTGEQGHFQQKIKDEEKFDNVQREINQRWEELFKQATEREERERKGSEREAEDARLAREREAEERRRKEAAEEKVRYLERKLLELEQKILELEQKLREQTIIRIS